MIPLKYRGQQTLVCCKQSREGSRVVTLNTGHANRGCWWERLSYHQRCIAGMLPWVRCRKLLVTTAHRLWTYQSRQTPNRCTPVQSHTENHESVWRVCVAVLHVLVFVLFSKLWVENLHTRSSKIRLIPCGVIHALQHPSHDLFQILAGSLLFLQRPLHLLVFLWGKTIDFRWLLITCWRSSFILWIQTI